MNLKKSLALVIATFVSIFIFLSVIPASAGKAPVKVLKLTMYTGSPNHPEALLVKEITSWMEKLTEGRVKIKYMPPLSYGIGPFLYEKVQRGDVDIAQWFWGYVSMEKLPFLMIGAMPLLYDDYVHYINAWSAEGDTLMKMCEQAFEDEGFDNIEVLTWQYMGTGDFAFNGVYPRVPEDLKGLKIRSSGETAQMLKLWGAPEAAIVMGKKDSMPALASGKLNGCQTLEHSWEFSPGFKEILDYHLDINWVVLGRPYLGNKYSLESLSEHDRLALDVVMKWLGDALTNQVLVRDKAFGPKLREEMGEYVKVYTPTPEEMKLWNAPREDFKAYWLKTTGERGKKAIELIEKYRK